MSIPAPPKSEPTIGAVAVALFHQLHQELREAIAELDHTGLNWAPCTNANSIATIVTHLVGSEAETLRCIAGIDAPRDRESEFRVGEQRLDGLLRQLDHADDLLDQVAPQLTAERMLADVSLTTLPPSERRPGATWLISALGHAREHVGHALLTKQLWRSGEPAR